MAVLKAKNLERQVNDILVGNGITDNEIKLFVSGRGPREQESFIKLFQAQAKIINSCAPVTVKLFHYFLCEQAYGNYVEVDVKSISLILHISEISVKRGIKELFGLGVIRIDKDLNDRRRNVYFLNPYVAWKGNPGDRLKAIKKIDSEDNQLKLL